MYKNLSSVSYVESFVGRHWVWYHVFVRFLILLLNILLPLLFIHITNLGHRGPHCFQNCAGERYFFIIFFSNFAFSDGKGKWCEVCVPWAIESCSMICFLQHAGRLWVMYRSWEELPKQENLLVCQCFSLFFQMCQITVIVSEMPFSEVSKFNLLFWYSHCISHTKHLYDCRTCCAEGKTSHLN